MVRTESILLIGNFLSKELGVRGISEELEILFLRRGWIVFHASHKKNKALRIIDMLLTTYRYKDKYNLANVEVFSGMAFRWAEMVCKELRMLRKPYCLTLHGGGLPDFYTKNQKRVSKLFLYARDISTPSHYLSSKFKSIRPDISIIPNGIYTSRYQTRTRDFSKPNLIWLRAFHKIYNPGLAIQVLAILRSQNLDCTLTMIGPDKHDGSYEEMGRAVDLYNLKDYINIPGAVVKDDVPKWLNIGDIFLNTTRYESFGVSVMEAAACGLPIVTTNAGELPFIWENEVDALLVQKDDARSMAEAVRRIITDPSLAVKLSINARKKAEIYDWGAIIPQWEELFTKTINHG